MKNHTNRLVIFTAISLLLSCVLTACGGNPSVSSPSEEQSLMKPVTGRELICTCDSEAQAREVASLYNIDLVRFSGHLASFHAEGDISSLIDLIETGKLNGWPALSINSSGSMDGGT